MINRIHSLFARHAVIPAIVVACGLSVIHLQAQSWRRYVTDSVGFMNGGQKHHVSIYSSEDGVSLAQVRWFDEDAVKRVVSLPFPLAGGIVCVAEDRFIVTGRTALADPLVGKLAIVEIDSAADTIQVASSVDLPGVDPIDAAVNGNLGLLALVDLNRRVVLVGSYSVAGGLPAASSFQLAADAQQLPGLSGYTPEIFVRPLGFELCNRRAMGWAMDVVSGSWQFSPVMELDTGVRWVVDKRFELCQADQVVIQCPGADSSPVSFEMRFPGAAGGVVASGVQTAASSPVVIAAPSAFMDFPGGDFVVVSAGGVSGIESSRVVRPLVRYGDPSAPLGSMEAGRGACRSELAYVGSDEFRVSGRMNCPMQEVLATVPFEYNAYLAIAFGLRGAGAPPDPVSVNGSDAVLTPSMTLEFLNEKQLMDVGGFSTGLPIPNDPGLEGIILLFQWYYQSVADGSQVVRSDVFATRIWGSPAAASAALAGGTPQPGGKSSVTPQARLGSARQLFRQVVDSRNGAGASARFQSVLDRF